jgi:hypothetical protein
MSEDTDDAFEETLAEAFESEYGTDEGTAADAAAKAAAFREDWDEDLAAEDVLDVLDGAPYDEFEHRFDNAIGELAAENEDCTDSREYRLAGFGALAADPTQGG